LGIGSEGFVERDLLHMFDRGVGGWRFRHSVRGTGLGVDFFSGGGGWGLGGWGLGVGVLGVGGWGVGGWGFG
jgi:hypothetical protein